MATYFNERCVKIGDAEYNVRELSVRQRKAVFDAFKADSDAAIMGAQLIVYGCREFADKTTDQVMDLPGSLFDELSNAVAEISGMGAGDSDEKKT